MSDKTDETRFSAEPIDISNETVAHALRITEQRNTNLMWLLDEIMETGCSKAEGMRKLALIDATDEEKVYLGYMLCKRIVFLKTPSPMRPLIMKRYGL